MLNPNSSVWHQPNLDRPERHPAINDELRLAHTGLQSFIPSWAEGYNGQWTVSSSYFYYARLELVYNSYYIFSNLGD